MQRRLFLAAACTAGCAAGCAELPEGAAPAALPGQPLPWRRLQGGFLTPALPALGAAPRPPGGMFTRWIAPGAIALRGHELLVADRATARLWRADVAGQNITAVAAAPVGPNTVLALGPDLSAWVLDPVARQVLRFTRDGRLMQTHGIGMASAAPVALALADGGATLLLGDGLGAQWSEQRGPGAIVRSVLPGRDDGSRVSGVDGLALGREGIFVLDRLAGVVHAVTREGRVRHSLGRGELLQPVALGVDRLDRVYVLDLQDQSIKRLRPGAAALRWPAALLGVQRIDGLAVDGLMMAVSDGLGAQVALFSMLHDTEA